MNKKSIGEKIVKLATVLAFASSALIPIYEIIAKRGIIFLANLHGPALCAALFAMGIMGRRYMNSCVHSRALRLAYPLVNGAIAALLSLSYSIRYIKYFMISPSILDFLYVLTLPVAVLFLVGVLMRGKPDQRS
jgi:hypothetical protein